MDAGASCDQLRARAYVFGFAVFGADAVVGQPGVDRFVDRMIARATKDLGGTVSYEDIIR